MTPSEAFSSCQRRVPGEKFFWPIQTLPCDVDVPFDWRQSIEESHTFLRQTCYSIQKDGSNACTMDRPLSLSWSDPLQLTSNITNKSHATTREARKVIPSGMMLCLVHFWTHAFVSRQNRSSPIRGVRECLHDGNANPPSHSARTGALFNANNPFHEVSTRVWTIWLLIR